MCAQINRLQVGCTTDYTTRPESRIALMPFYIEWLIHSYLHEAQFDTLGNKKPHLRMVDGVINLVAGDGYAPPTSRL